MARTSGLGPVDDEEPNLLADLESIVFFSKFVRVLSSYINDLIDVPRTFEQLRTEHSSLFTFVTLLHQQSFEHSAVAALLILKWHYSNADTEDAGLSEARGLACEIVAWRYLAHLSDEGRMDVLLQDLPALSRNAEERAVNWGDSQVHRQVPSTETEPLLGSQARADEEANVRTVLPRLETGGHTSINRTDDALITPFLGLNVLEIAAVADAKKFMSQKPVQRIITDMWKGSIVFWDTLDIDTKKRAKRYDKKTSSPYSRLRVPKYQKAFDAVFLASFLALYYTVLLERAPERVTIAEVALYMWLAAFAYDEFGEYRDAGTLFYAADIWNVTDACIVLIALAFSITRLLGLVWQDDSILRISMDILSLEALLLVPRICALFSLHPFFGTLIPCLKEMSGDFIKFLGIVIILYLGWLTTFTMLARDNYTPREISWYLVYVFFGSSYLGLDIASDISKVLGPPLMIIFICMTNILLITSLISLLSNTLDKVMEHSREQYLFQYSVFVLEASASRRLTYFFPPMNLFPLVLLRPLRLCLSSAELRGARIAMLKITHLPYVAAIVLYESFIDSLPTRPSLSAIDRRPGSSPHVKRFSGMRQSISHTSTLRTLARGNKSEASLTRTPLRTERPRPMPAADSTVDELRWAVSKLTEQVQELTRRLEPNSVQSSPVEDPFQ